MQHIIDNIDILTYILPVNVYKQCLHNDRLKPTLITYNKKPLLKDGVENLN